MQSSGFLQNIVSVLWKNTKFWRWYGSISKISIKYVILKIFFKYPYNRLINYYGFFLSKFDWIYWYVGTRNSPVSPLKVEKDKKSKRAMSWLVIISSGLIVRESVVISVLSPVNISIELLSSSYWKIHWPISFSHNFPKCWHFLTIWNV